MIISVPTNQCRASRSHTDFSGCLRRSIQRNHKQKKQMPRQRNKQSENRILPSRRRSEPPGESSSPSNRSRRKEASFHHQHSHPHQFPQHLIKWVAEKHKFKHKFAGAEPITTIKEITYRRKGVRRAIPGRWVRRFGLPQRNGPTGRGRRRSRSPAMDSRRGLAKGERWGGWSGGASSRRARRERRRPNDPTATFRRTGRGRTSCS